MSVISTILKGANKSHIKSATLFKHIRRLVIIFVVAIVVLNALWFYTRTKPYERYLLGRNLNAWYQIGLRKAFTVNKTNLEKTISALTMNWHPYRGTDRHVSVVDYKNSLYYKMSAQIGWRQFYEGLGVTGSLIALIFILYFYVLYRRGKKASEKKVLTGLDKTTVKQLNKLLKKRKLYSELPIGNTRYVKGSEIEHTAAIGGTRMGKSIYMKWLGI